MVQRIAAAILVAIWLLLVLLGKGGFVHLILLTALGIASVNAVATYRARMTVTPADKF
jgi:hypothetical protein